MGTSIERARRLGGRLGAGGAACLLAGMAACGGSSGGTDAGRDAPQGDGGSADGAPDTPADAPADAASDGAPADLGWETKPAPPPDKPQLWYWHHSYLSGTSPVEPAKSEALIDRAVAAGYDGIAFWDAAWDFVNRPDWDPTKQKAVLAYAASKGLKILPTTAPFGYSNDLLLSDPNLAEGQRVVGSRFKAEGGKLVFQNEQPPLANGDFESGMSGWFDIGDARVSVDAGVAHGGGASVRFAGSPSASDNARIRQKATVKPWRLYHLSLWIKTSGLARSRPTLNLLDLDSKPGQALSVFYEDVNLGATADWTRFDVTFNSRASTTIYLYMGLWGGHSGDVWFDDIALEETALVNVLRRAGTPLRVYAGGKDFTEGTDYAPIADPALAASPGHYDRWHTPPVPTLPGGSGIAEGTEVAIDSYSVFPIYGEQVGSCLSEPAIQDWEKANLKAQDALLPKDASFAGWFFSYDEMRHMNSCAACRAMSKSAGQLLAWHVGLTVDEARAIRPGVSIYVWSDMFDPTHNAHDDYYYVEGDIAGSWEGLRPGTVVMNWIRTPASLAWFSGTDPKQPHPFPQILSGYYDSGDGAASASADLAAAKGIPGIVGAMYTSWADDYDQMAAYAKGILDGWDAYKKSL